MKNVVVARRYAKALYELAQQNKEIDDVLRGFGNLVLTYKTLPDLERFMQNPLHKPEQKSDVVKTITSNKLVLKLIELLARRKRLDLLLTVYDELLSLSDVDKGIHRVLVKTATALTEIQKKTVETDLAKKLGGVVFGQFDIAQDLLGGIWIKMGDKVLDATLRGKIEDLRFALTNSLN